MVEDALLWFHKSRRVDFFQSRYIWWYLSDLSHGNYNWIGGWQYPPI